MYEYEKNKINTDIQKLVVDWKKTRSRFFLIMTGSPTYINIEIIKCIYAKHLLHNSLYLF